uniref:Ground-like domain-containing protein n=1 Tax=Parascaris equorum TaxID=6256 RepID=A0A914RRI0_PAREQ
MLADIERMRINIDGNLNTSKRLIQLAAEAQFGGQFDVICASNDFSYLPPLILKKKKELWTKTEFICRDNKTSTIFECIYNDTHLTYRVRLKIFFANAFYSNDARIRQSPSIYPSIL